MMGPTLIGRNMFPSDTATDGPQERSQPSLLSELGRFLRYLATGKREAPPASRDD